MLTKILAQGSIGDAFNPQKSIFERVLALSDVSGGILDSTFGLKWSTLFFIYDVWFRVISPKWDPPSATRSPHQNGFLSAYKIPLLLYMVHRAANRSRQAVNGNTKLERNIGLMFLGTLRLAQLFYYGKEGVWREPGRSLTNVSIGSLASFDDESEHRLLLTSMYVVLDFLTRREKGPFDIFVPKDGPSELQRFKEFVSGIRDFMAKIPNFVDTVLAD